MVAIKSTISLLALLCSSAVFATPVPEAVADTNDEFTPNVDPFSGVSFTPYENLHCKIDQGNTNVNIGTRACVNVSNMSSYKITADQCKKAEMHYFSGLDCKGKHVKHNVMGPGCHTKHGQYKSIYVKPLGCPA